MARKTHFEKCKAPLCMSNKKENWKNELIWYPGEKICQRKPYTRIQKNQAKINKFVKNGKFIHEDRYFTAEMLEKRDKISHLTRGRDPGKK